jgi:hypothetical protein
MQLHLGFALEQALGHVAKASLVKDCGVNAYAITVLHSGTTSSDFPGPSARSPRRPEIDVAKFIADTQLMRSIGLTPEADPLQHLAELASAYPAQNA